MMTQDKAKIGLETVTKKSQNNKLVDGFMTPDLANIGQITLTERGQSNQIKKQNDQDLIDLLSWKELLIIRIERFKTEIRKFHWLEENGFSTRNCLTEIDLSYDEIKTELEDLVESFEDQIGQAGETDQKGDAYSY